MSLNGRPQTFASAPAAALPGAAEALAATEPRRSFPFVYALCQIFGWGTWAMLGSIIAVKSGAIRFSIALVSYGLYSVYGALTSHLLRLVIRRKRWLSLPFHRYIPRIAAAAAVCVAVMTASLYLINIRLLHLFDAGAYLVPFLGMVAFNTALIYAFWLTVYLAVQVSRRRRQAELINLRMELALRDAQYRSLSAQVNPHFLFNSLNSLRALILIDPQKAIVAVTHLAGVLRYSLAADSPAESGSANERVVPLYQEIEAVDDYLALERIRFEDRLRITRQIDPAALHAAVPRMMLQHLVENAVKHGIAPRPDGGDLHIAASIHAGCLQITVRNPGKIAPAYSGTSIGLHNTRQRLALLYGPASVATCTLEEHNGTVAATLMLPLEPAIQPQPAGTPTSPSALPSAEVVPPLQHQEALDARPSGR